MYKSRRPFEGFLVVRRETSSALIETVTLTSSTDAMLASVCRYPGSTSQDSVKDAECASLAFIEPIMLAWVATHPGGTSEEAERREKTRDEMKAMVIAKAAGASDLTGETISDITLRSMQGGRSTSWFWDESTWRPDSWSQESKHDLATITFEKGSTRENPHLIIYVTPKGELNWTANAEGISLWDKMAMLNVTDGDLMGPVREPRTSHVIRPSEAQQTWLRDNGLGEVVDDETVWTVKALPAECWDPSWLSRQNTANEG